MPAGSEVVALQNVNKRRVVARGSPVPQTPPLATAFVSFGPFTLRAHERLRSLLRD